MGNTVIMSSKCILAGNVCLRHYDDIADATLTESVFRIAIALFSSLEIRFSFIAPAPATH